jgi:hypothetical protein
MSGSFSTASENGLKAGASDTDPPWELAIRRGGFKRNAFGLIRAMGRIRRHFDLTKILDQQDRDYCIDALRSRLEGSFPTPMSAVPVDIRAAMSSA